MLTTDSAKSQNTKNVRIVVLYLQDLTVSQTDARAESYNRNDGFALIDLRFSDLVHITWGLGKR